MCHILGRMVGAVILKISLGYTVKEDDDPFLQIVNKAVDSLSVVVTPGWFLVDMLPICTFHESLHAFQLFEGPG